MRARIQPRALLGAPLLAHVDVVVGDAERRALAVLVAAADRPNPRQSAQTLEGTRAAHGRAQPAGLLSAAIRSSSDARLLDLHFEAVGMSFLEMAIGWCWPIDRLLEIVRIEGREHLERALARGKGVLLFAAHFTPIEVCVAVLESLWGDVSCMYRPQRNAMMDVLIRRGRSRFAKEQIPRDNVRMLVRHLRNNYVVAYMPDQTYLGKQSALLPFFGVPAVTNVATSKLAMISGAVVLPYFFRRLRDKAGYVVNIGAPLPDFPTDDAAARHPAARRGARGLHSGGAGAILVALQKIQGTAAGISRSLRQRVRALLH